MLLFEESQKQPEGYISKKELMNFLIKKYREYSDKGEQKERNTIIKVIDKVNEICPG